MRQLDCYDLDLLPLITKNALLYYSSPLSEEIYLKRSGKANLFLKQYWRDDA